MWIFIAIAVLIVVLTALVSSQPKDFKYTRSITIQAPAVAVFPHVNDFHQWGEWSPWEKVDLNTKKTFGGPPAGAGATYAWSGNRQVGSGDMTITDSRPNESIKIAINFTAPMKASNSIEFTFKQEGEQTVVTQSMWGCNSFMGKLFGLIMSMDKMIGGQFEKGLADLKKVSESSH